MEPVLHERVYCVIVARKSDSIQRHDPMGVSLDRTLRLIDVRQIGPDSERGISGRCCACGVVLIARLDNRESSNLEALRSKLEKLFARNLTETAYGKGQDPPRNRASSTRQSKFLPEVSHFSPVVRSVCRLPLLLSSLIQ